jgi:uncharacterized membrane protein YgcG
LFLGFCLLLIAPEILLGKQKPKIKWIPEKVSVNFEEGEEIVYEVYFESDKEAKNVELWMTPSLSQILKVEPLQFNEIKANERNAVKLRFSGLAGEYEGTLHVKSEGFNLANPLSIEVKIAKKEGSVEADEEDLCASGKIASDFSENWKRWKEYPYRPSLEDMEKIAGESPVVFVFEFKSIWDPVFKDHPRSPDGFLIFHIAFLLFDAKEVFIKVEAPDEVRMIGGNEFRIGEVSKNEVKSFYVPIKMCGNYGTFPIRARLEYQPVFENNSGFLEFRVRTLFIVREHRRDIKAFDPAEYSIYLLEKRLERYEKREGAAYYPPIAYADDPVALGEVRLESETDPLITVDLEQVYDFPPYIPQDVDIEFEPTDSEIEPQKSSEESGMSGRIMVKGKECYTFSGRVIIRENYSLQDIPLVGASINVYDADGFLNPDDFICSARTDGFGYFSCNGCAYDLGSNPDPYIVVLACNGKLQVFRSGTNRTYSQTVWERDGLKGGTYNIGTVRVGSAQDMNDTTLRAFWVFRFANTAYAVNKNARGGKDIGDYEIIFPASGNNSSYSTSDRRIYIIFDQAEASIVAHEFGHALMDRLYGFRDWPSPGGPHTLCSNNLTDERQKRGLAWAEGFANAVALVSFNTPYSCWQGLPWNPGYRVNCINLEGSTIRLADDNPQNRWIRHYCGYCREGNLGCGDQNEGYVTSAIWDLFDDVSNDDRDCTYHINAGRRACDSASFPWRITLEALTFRPQNYAEFVANLPLSCEQRNQERQTSRFNNIFTGDYINCTPPPSDGGGGGGGGGGGSGGGGGGGGGGCSSISPIITSFIFVFFFLILKRIIPRGRKIL